MSTQEPTITPRPRQRKAAKAVVKNLQLDKPKSLGEVLESVGYGTGLQTQPNRVIQSAGFKQALREMGLTEELITSSLVEDIAAKPQRRLGELTLGAKILGMTDEIVEPPASNQTTTYNFIFSPETRAAVKEIEDRIKARLTQPHVQPN